MRLNMFDGLSDVIRRKKMSGAFPARAYMYGIKGFTRVNKIPQEKVEAFVNATSCKGFSTRELFVLSRAFFNGSSGIEQLVLEGDAHKALRIITSGIDDKAIPKADTVQQLLLKNLESSLTSINFITANASKLDISNNEIIYHVNYLTRILLNNLSNFSKTIEELHDRSRPAICGTNSVQTGSKPQSHCTAVTH